MKERLFDKILIIILQSFLIIFFNNHVDGNIVIDILMAAILMIITELFRKNTVAFGATVFSVVIFLIFKTPVIIISISVYGLLSSDWFAVFFNKVINNYSVYSSRMNERQHKNMEELKTGEVILFVIHFCMVGATMIFVSSDLLSIIVLLMAVLLALRTNRSIGKYNSLESRYDKSREKMYDMKKSSEEMIHRADENIYMATLEERNRIAREIHDNVGHMLTRAIVQMQALKVVNHDENTKPLIDAVDETVNQAMLNIRRSVHELHDDSIDISIMANELLKTLPDRFTRTCKTSIESAVPAEYKNAILSILKESITNIVKYSNGNEVKVEIIEHTAFWRISIFDNGENEIKEYDQNFQNMLADSGIGLANIYARTRKLGGRTNISSNKDGFTILVTIPKL